MDSWNEATAEQFSEALQAARESGAALMALGADAQLHVEFYFRPVKNEQASKSAGRSIFEKVEYVKIRAPGQKDGPDRPVEERDKERFAYHYAQFKRRGESPEVVGTPLALAPFIEVHELATCRELGVYSVEQLAAVSDSVAQKVGRDLVRKAQVFLDAATGSAATAKLSDENEALRAEVAELKEQMAEVLKEKKQRKKEHE